MHSDSLNEIFFFVKVNFEKKVSRREQMQHAKSYAEYTR